MERDPEESLRLFFALMLPEEPRQEIVALQERLRESGVPVKWVERQNLHITLKFLGATPALMVDDLKQVGEAVAAEIMPFEAGVSGLGAFPKLRHPQTIILRIGRGAEELAELARVLHRRLGEEALLLTEDKKGFVAHCTIGRVKQEQGAGRLVEALGMNQEFETPDFWCERFGLYRSDLTGDGPVYQEVAGFTLGGEED